MASKSNLSISGDAGVELSSSDAVSDDPGCRPGSKKTIVTKQKIFGVFFGDPLPSLDQSKKPTSCEVIRFWISTFDKERGQKYIFPAKEKNKVLDIVVNSLRSLPVWESSPVMDYLSVRKKVSELLEEANAFEKRTDLKKSPDKIPEKVAKFNKVFELVSSRTLDSSSGGVGALNSNKRKSQELEDETVREIFLIVIISCDPCN